MYAVIKTGGKQYRVQPGDTLEVELLDGDKGKTVDLSDVLLIADEPNACCKAITLPAWQRRVQWSMLLVRNPALNSFSAA